MSFCQHCNSQLQDGQFQCNVCGAVQFQPYCSQCHEPLDLRYPNCRRCGAGYQLPFGNPYLLRQSNLASNQTNNSQNSDNSVESQHVPNRRSRVNNSQPEMDHVNYSAVDSQPVNTSNKNIGTGLQEYDDNPKGLIKGLVCFVLLAIFWFVWQRINASFSDLSLTLGIIVYVICGVLFSLGIEEFATNHKIVYHIQCPYCKQEMKYAKKSLNESCPKCKKTVILHDGVPEIVE